MVCPWDARVSQDYRDRRFHSWERRHLLERCRHPCMLRMRSGAAKKTPSRRNHQARIPALPGDACAPGMPALPEVPALPGDGLRSWLTSNAYQTTRARCIPELRVLRLRIQWPSLETAAAVFHAHPLHPVKSCGFQCKARDSQSPGRHQGWSP